MKGSDGGGGEDRSGATAAFVDQIASEALQNALQSQDGGQSISSDPAGGSGWGPPGPTPTQPSPLGCLGSAATGSVVADAGGLAVDVAGTFMAPGLKSVLGAASFAAGLAFTAMDPDAAGVGGSLVDLAEHNHRAIAKVSADIARSLPMLSIAFGLVELRRDAAKAYGQYQACMRE